MPRFEVVGPHVVDGSEPGDKVEIDSRVDEVGRARRLWRAGHIAEPETVACPVDGCGYEGSRRGLASHSRVHEDDDE